MTDDDVLERAAIDGRIAFTIGAFVAAGALVALLDRIGAPERFVAVAGPACTLVGLALIGVLLRNMRISRFYAGARAVPAAYAGFAVAALALGLALPFIPPAADHFSGIGVFAGFAGGLACAVLISGPYLRRTGAFSIADLVASRFPNLALRLGAALVVAASALLAALAGYETAVAGLGTIAGLGRPAATAIVGLILVLVAAPGGLLGVVWAAAAAGGIMSAAFALPLALQTFAGRSVALPLFGDSLGWTTALDQIAVWQGDIGQQASLPLSLGMALGMASAAPLLAPLAAVRDRAAAVRAGFGALFWGAALAALVSATVAGSTLGLLDATVGKRPERLPDSIYAASATRLVAICGAAVSTPGEARAACLRAPGSTGVLRAQDVDTRGVFLLTALPPLSGLGAAVSGMVWAGVVAIGLVLAAAGLLAAATALGNDAFHRVRDRSALTSRRLAITRLIFIVAVAVLGASTTTRESDPRTLIGLSLALSAAGLAPLMALALWPRARGLDALIALCVGLGMAEAMLTAGPASVERLATSAVTGCLCGLAAGLIASFIGGGDRNRGRAFLAAVLKPDGDVIAPDKGA